MTKLALPCLLALTLALGFGTACSDDGNAMPDGPILRPDGDNDMDLDGVKDDVDNCPTATNAFQGNEDGDRFGDACDPCPPIADDNPADGDGDGVADACDPLTIMFGDRVAFFEGFHQGAPQGWDAAGTWTTNNDSLVSSATGPGHFALIVTDRTRETLTASITVTSVAGADSYVGLVDNKVPNGTSGIVCALTGAPELAVYNTGDVADAQTQAYELTAGTTYLVRLRRDNSAYTCTAERTGATATATKTLPLSNEPYQSGLVINAAAIRVNWFMVVESL